MTFKPLPGAGAKAGVFSVGPSVLPKPKDGAPFLELLPRDRDLFEVVLIAPPEAPVVPEPAPPGGAAVVPLPPSALLLLTAFGAIGVWRRRSRDQ